MPLRRHLYRRHADCFGCIPSGDSGFVHGWNSIRAANCSPIYVRTHQNYLGGLGVGHGRVDTIFLARSLGQEKRYEENRMKAQPAAALYTSP